jgi:hypothetical protein
MTLGHGRGDANAPGPEQQSFFASFCSQKEVLKPNKKGSRSSLFR